MRKKDRRTKKWGNMKGGGCVPCMAAAAPSIMNGIAGLGSAIATGGIMTSMTYSNNNGKVKRNMTVKLRKRNNGKVKNKVYELRGKVLYIDGKKIKNFKNIKSASKSLKQRIQRCVKSKGWKKC